MAAKSLEIVNALTIDVEEHFQTPAFASLVPRPTWDSVPCRTEANIDRILALLAEHDARATFFMLGWIADRFPEVARRIVAAGHELASLGYERVPVVEQGYGQFLADIRLAKAVLEDISGIPVLGYRAPDFSIGAVNTWAFDCIAEAGYRYSSSVYPFSSGPQSDLHGERFAHEIRTGLLEVPVTTLEALGSKWPVGGGDYFGRLPYRASRWLMQRVNDVDKRAISFQFRAWEVDPDQTHLRSPWGKGVGLQGANATQIGARLRRLLSDFRWNRIDRLFLTMDRVT
jgi:polysaccharide deacetylase family protein (PEP-CTERM system associated)